MDFLGLRNLTDPRRRAGRHQGQQGRHVDLEHLAVDDKATYDLLARGDTLGVFQLEGGPMRALLRSMRPDRFDDISAVNALYRPGPMGANAHNDYADRKMGRKPVEPIHPELAEPLADILDDTYGVIVYQEQVLLIAQKLAGYSVGKADLLRKAMGKKKKEILDKEFEPFASGMRANGYSDGAIKAIWDILVPFSDYAFNKAHTASYGLVAYWTAYLKAKYPRRVHGRAADLGRRRQGQVRALPERVPPDGHQGAAAGRQRLDRAVHPGRQRHQVRHGGGAQRRRRGRRVDRGDQARPRAPSPASLTSCARCRSTSATSASSSRWSRPARSTRSGTRGAAWS